MKIVIPDDYQDMVDQLPCFSLIRHHDVKRYREPARDLNELADRLKDADIVMMLRLQRERMTSNLVPSQREYFHFFGLDHEKLSRAKPDALIMHPGPMNRGVEIDSSVADDQRSVIREQVEMGVAVRMAVLQALARHLPNH